MPLFGGPPDVAKLAARQDTKGLIKALSYSGAEAIRMDAAKALGEIGDASVVVPLIDALREPSGRVRKVAVEALGKTRDARVVKPLLAAFADTNMRTAASEALARINDPLTIEPLAAALSNEAWEVRLVVVGTLGQIRDARALEPLVAALDDRNASVRAAACLALEQLAWSPDRGTAGAVYWSIRGQWDECVRIGAPAVEPLIFALNGHNVGDGRAASARRNAAVALGQINDARAIESLVAALEVQDRGVGRAAAEALDSIAWKPDRGATGVAYWVAKGEWDECVKIGAPAVERLIVFLDDPDENRRTAVSLALGEIGMPAVEPLAAVLENGGVKGVRAAWALGLIDDGRVFDIFFAAFTTRDREVRKAAAEGMVALYRSGKLDAAKKARLLAQRGAITASHRDEIDTEYKAGCYIPVPVHVDKGGLGVDFPL